MAESQQNSEDGIIFASDCRLKEVTIYTSDGKSVDISNLVVEVNIYEDLFSPCMSGSLVIGEALDILTKFKLHGNEYISISIDKPTLNKPIQKMFRIYKVSDRTFSTSSLQNYLIYFCSEEMILSTQNYISKSYKGMTISTMINDIMKNKLSVSKEKLSGSFMNTEGVFDIIIPRMQPLEAIQWLCTRAYTKSDSLFFFYEDRDGFNFVSYEELTKQPSYGKYSYGPKLTNQAQDNVLAITNLEVVQDFDIMSSGQYGAYSSALMSYDLIGRKQNVRVISARNASLLNESFPVNDSVNRFNLSLDKIPDYSLKYYPSTDSNPLGNPTNPENWLQQKAAKLAQLSMFKCVATIPGDVMMKVGRIVDVEIPLAIPKTAAGDQISNLRSGKYLVTSVHHVIMNSSMSTVMELVSDSVTGQLNAAVNSSPALQQIKRA